MNRRKNSLLPGLLALAVATLSGCGGGSGAVPSTVGNAQAPVQPPISTSSSAIPYGRSLMAGATYVGPAHLKTVGLDVYVQMRDRAGLLQYANRASDPRSALFRHWLSPLELGERFGASVSDYNAVVQYLRANGLAVKTFPQRQMVRLRGPQTGVERAFGISLGIYKKSGQTFLAPSGDPRPPATLHLAALGKLVGFVSQRRHNVPVRASASVVEGYAPQQIGAAFDYSGARAAGFAGNSITIGIIGTASITDGDPRLSPGDGALFRTNFSVGGAGTIVQDFGTDANVSPGNPSVPGGQYSSGLASPPPVTSGTSSGCQAQGYDPNDPATRANITDFSTCNPEDSEAQLDTEQAEALAPNATVRFYIAYNPNECFTAGACRNAPATPALGIDLTDDEIQQAIGDDLSDVVSLSFGEPEPDGLGFYFGADQQGFGPTEIASLVAEGTGVFVASGDSGALDCNGATALCVSYPATDPNAVSVGGVNSPIDAAGRLVGPLTGWGLQTQSGGGSGGGCSRYFSAPSFESGIAGFPCAGKRGQPDVSLDADTATGVAVFVNAPFGAEVLSIGGTSVSSPEMAAMWALVLQACAHTAACTARGSGPKPYRLGNPNAYFYPAYTNAGTYASTFYDVRFGNNGLAPGGPGFAAGAGYDLVTGIGVPYARNLIRAVVGV